MHYHFLKWAEKCVRELHSHAESLLFNVHEKKGKPVCCVHRVGQKAMSLNCREGDTAQVLQNFFAVGGVCRSSALFVKAG